MKIAVASNDGVSVSLHFGARTGSPFMKWRMTESWPKNCGATSGPCVPKVTARRTTHITIMSMTMAT